jgi:hypothetical protein
MPARCWPCWRRWCSRARTSVRVESAYTIVSSPSRAAGKMPTTPLARNHFSSMIRSSMSWASAIEPARGLPGSGVVKDVGIASPQLPRREEGRPVDIPRAAWRGRSRGTRESPVDTGWATVAASKVDLWGGGDGRGDTTAAGRSPLLAACRTRIASYSAAIDSTSAGLLLGRKQLRDNGNRARRILHPNDWRVIALIHLDGRVRLGRRGAADQQGDVETLALHLRGHVHHLIERRRDQPGQPDRIGAFRSLGSVQDLLRRAPSRRDRAPHSCCTAAPRRRCSCRCRGRRP